MSLEKTYPEHTFKMVKSYGKHNGNYYALCEDETRIQFKVHTRELLKLDSSVKNMERLLFFYNIPEKLVEDNEAELVAREIIRIESNNRVANSILK